MNSTTTAATDRNATELDQSYIDMMIPHHRGMIGLAQAAQSRLTEPRLQQMAQKMIDTESAEMRSCAATARRSTATPTPRRWTRG